MRTIKFRGKRVTDGEWVYGGICHTSHLNVGYHIMINIGEFYQVIPETVGQFMGVINEQEVYTGDLCEFLLSPIAFEWDSTENLFGVEAQNSKPICTKATQPLKCVGEIYFNEEGFFYYMRNIQVKVLDFDKEEDWEDLGAADPNEIAGGADGYEVNYEQKYDTLHNLEFDHGEGITWTDMINFKIIGTTHTHPQTQTK